MPQPTQRRTCSIEGCPRLHSAHGYCAMHGRRIRIHGNAGPAESTWDIKKTCSVDGCDETWRLARGLCKRHYARWKRHGDPGVAGKMHAVSWAGVECAVGECSGNVASLGYCTAHYKRFKRYGDPLIKRPTTPPAIRFWSRVNKLGPIPLSRPGLGPCWVWTAGKISSGYGLFSVSKVERVLAHRWSYTQVVGEIPDDYVVDHLCRNRECVNPHHLEAVTNEENLRRGDGYALRNGQRDACRNGHPYTPDNVYIDPTKKSVRCRECARLRDKSRIRMDQSSRTGLRPIDPIELRALYESGCGAGYLRNHFRVSLNRIYEVMEAENLPRRRRGRPSRKAA